MGIDPRPFSMRELVWMATGRSRAEWTRTIAVVSWAWVGAGQKPLTPWQIAPDVFPDDEAGEVTDRPLSLDELDAQSAAAWAGMHAYFLQRRG